MGLFCLFISYNDGDIGHSLSQPHDSGSFCMYLNVVIIKVGLGMTNSLSSYKFYKHVNYVLVHVNILGLDTPDRDSKGYPLLYQLYCPFHFTCSSSGVSSLL